MLPDSVAHFVATHPAGLVCRKQIFRAGYGDSAIHRWVRDGFLERIAPGWYRVAGGTRHPLQAQHLVRSYFEMSAKEPKPMITGTAALQAYGIDLEASGPPGVLLPHTGRVRIRTGPFAVIRARDLREVRAWNSRGLRLAEPARALADMLALEGRKLEEVVHTAYLLINHLRIRPVELIDRWAALGDAGSRQLAEIARTGRLDVESPGEWGVLLHVFRAYPPPPDTQVQVTPRRRADFAYVLPALIMEYFGLASHRDRVDEDAVKASEYRRASWAQMVVTKSMVKDPKGLSEEAHDYRLRRQRDMIEGRIARPSLPPQLHRRVPLTTAVPLG